MVIEDFSAQPNQHNCVINMEHLTFSLMFTACLFCGGELQSLSTICVSTNIKINTCSQWPDRAATPAPAPARYLLIIHHAAVCRRCVLSGLLAPECNEEHEKLGCLNILNILNWQRNPSNRSAWASCLLPECVGWWVWPAHAPPSCPRCGAMPWLPPSPVGWHTQHRQDRA